MIGIRASLSLSLAGGSVSQRIFSAVDFGALGDSVTDDASAIQAAVNAAAGTVNGGAYGSFVYFPKGTYLVGSQITIPNGVGLAGAGPSATIIRAKSSFNGASLIRNLHQDGTQEFAFIESLQIDGNQGNGAICSTAVVDLVSLFINSYVRDVVILNGSNVGLHVGAAAAMGPMYFENVWLANNVGHNLFCEEMAGNVGACDGLCFVNLTSEHQGSGKSAIYLKGLGSAAQWSFFNTHVEEGQGGATTQTCVTIDGVSDVMFHGLQLLTGNPAAMTAGIAITNVAQNARIQIHGVINANLINPVISDAKNSVTIGAINVPIYITPDVNVRGGMRFTPHTTAGAKSLVAQKSDGTDRAWFDDQGALTGSSALTGSGVDLVGDGTNNAALALVNSAKSRAFRFFFPDSSFLRLDYLTGAANCMDWDNSGNTRAWHRFTMLESICATGELVPPQITTSQDNYSPTGLSTASVLLINASGAVNITGFATGASGRFLWVWNTGSAAITLKHQTTSTATNQIIGTAGADVTLTQDCGVLLYYSPSLTKWVVIGDNVSGSTALTVGGHFGDGSDGTATFDGSTAVTGCTRSGSVYTAIKDLAFTTSTFTNGVTLDLSGGTAGFELNCSVALVGPASGTATIKCNGNAASGATAGAALTSSSPIGATSGAGAGGIQNAGQGGGAAGTWQNSFKAGNGGNGGASATNAGATGGTAGSTLTDAQASMVTWADIRRARTLGGTILSGGAGGASGGGTTGVASGGGGGSGGGWCRVNAKTITNGAQLAIQANGGAGANGVGGNAGGGGGGGGGYAIVAHGGSTTPAGLVSGTNVTAAGGALGSPAGTGSAGTAGGTGQVRIFNLGAA